MAALSGGRTWWAHFEFARINIAPTILRKKMEDLREAGAPKRSVNAEEVQSARSAISGSTFDDRRAGR